MGIVNQNDYELERIFKKYHSKENKDKS